MCLISVPVGEELMARVVNSLGQPVDGQGPINTQKCAKREPEMFSHWALGMTIEWLDV